MVEAKVLSKGEMDRLAQFVRESRGASEMEGLVFEFAIRRL